MGKKADFESYDFNVSSISQNNKKGSISCADCGRAVANLPDARIRAPYAKPITFVDDFFRTILSVNQIALSVQQHFHGNIVSFLSRHYGGLTWLQLRHASASANDLTHCENKKNGALLRLEEKIDEGVLKSLTDIPLNFGCGAGKAACNTQSWGFTLHASSFFNP